MRTSLDKAISEARKKLPFCSMKERNALLMYAADDMADAYRIGAEEAQHEIILRLSILKATEDGK